MPDEHVRLTLKEALEAYSPNHPVFLPGVGETTVMAAVKALSPEQRAVLVRWYGSEGQGLIIHRADATELLPGVGQPEHLATIRWSLPKPEKSPDDRPAELPSL